MDDHNYYNLIDSAAYYSSSLIYSITDELFLYHTKERWENFGRKKWALMLQSFSSASAAAAPVTVKTLQKILITSKNCLFAFTFDC